VIRAIHSGWTPAAFEPRSPYRAQPSSGASVTVASASRDVTASLNITTREGDTVSISASFDATAAYGAARGDGQRASTWSLSASNQVSFQVQGNLSEQEMKDISRVVKTFLHDLGSMLKGRDVSVANVAAGDLTTLQSVSASARETTSVTAVAAGVGRTPPQPGDTRVQQLAGDAGAPARGPAGHSIRSYAARWLRRRAASRLR
jgi:hypothetical protein